MDKLFSELKAVLNTKIDDLPTINIGLDSDILKSQKVVDHAKSTLNEDQLKSFDGIVDFLSDIDKDLVTITGYAGTGKTYLISKIISAISGSVAMTAPTNKAVKVLADNKSDEMKSVTYATIHRLLALKMKWIYPNGKKGETFKPFQKLVSIWGKEPTVNNYDILIIDEVSMLDDELFDMLIDIKEEELKIIFLGDAAQIPPVNKIDSIPLLKEKQEEYEIGVFELNKTMRQKEGSGILKTADSIRDNRFGFSDTIKDRTNKHDTIFVNRFNQSDTDMFLKEMLLSFSSKEFDEDPNHCKVIAWRNKTVDALNQVIRTHIYRGKELHYIMPGEKLIADTPIIKKKNIIFSTSDEFTVKSYEEDVFIYRRPDTPAELSERQQLSFDNMSTADIDKKKKEYRINYYKTVVIHHDLTFDIDIIHPDSVQVLGWAKSEAFKMKLFPLFEMLTERFASVKYNYAITCHKSQGSTYEKVFIIEDDIDANSNMIERNRIKYTAVSRASKKLYIISKRNSYGS